MDRTLFIGVISTALLWNGILSGQSRAFAVASIKEHTGRLQRVGPAISGTHVEFQAMDLNLLVIQAYDLRAYQLEGASFNASQSQRSTSWMNRTRWDIAAQAEGDAPLTPSESKLALQALLAERFQLRLRRERRDVPVLALVQRGPHKLTESGPGDSRGGIRILPGGIRLTVTHGNMTQFALSLTSNGGQDRPVIDRTGLNGQYDFSLEWAEGDIPKEGSDLPLLTTAVREQLGLRLEPSTESMEVFVIEHAERPTEN